MAPIRFYVAVPGPIWEPIFVRLAVTICPPTPALPLLAFDSVINGCSRLSVWKNQILKILIIICIKVAELRSILVENDQIEPYFNNTDGEQFAYKYVLY